MGFDETLSFYLFSRPSFVEGLGRTLDLSGQADAYNRSTTPEQADMTATANDWLMVGADVRSAIQGFGASQA